MKHTFLIVVGIALSALAAWYLTRPKPDLRLIGKDVKAYRLAGVTGPTGSARLDLSFTRASDDMILNVGIDLNADGKMADYATIGGVRQSEWIVRNAPVKIEPGRKSFPFEIADPDVVTRNDFKLVAVLTKDPQEAWDGKVPAASAALSTFVSSIAPKQP